MGEGWCPWEEQESRPWLRLAEARLPSGMSTVYARRGGQAAICLNETATPIQIKCGMAQELVHDVWTPGPLPTNLVEKFEHFAQQRAAELLVTEGDITPISHDLIAAGLPEAIVEVARLLRVTPEMVARRLAQVVLDWVA